MPRRGYDRRRRCAHEGCREWSIVNYEYKRDYADAVRREKGQPPWRCTRHAKPEEVLSEHNLERSTELISDQLDHGRFWGSHGFIYGPGFKVWAKDFPPGTTLVITARIVLPDGYTPTPMPEGPPAQPTYFADRVELDP